MTTPRPQRAGAETFSDRSTGADTPSTPGAGVVLSGAQLRAMLQWLDRLWRANLMPTAKGWQAAKRHLLEHVQ